MNVVAPPQSGVPLVGDENLFDSLFSSEKSLLNLLIAIRSSDINDDDMLELRDLVLEYAQLRDQAKKQSVKDQLNVLLRNNPAIITAALKDQAAVSTAAPVDAKTEAPSVSPAAAKPRIGANRLSPVFKAAPAPIKVDEAPKAEPIKETVSVPPATSKAAAPPTPTAPAASMAPHVANPMERINEIKRIVNGQVGNPINLIDSDNNVGREYMNALLDAMKKSSGSGLAGELDVAMARLEKAYVAVENHIAGHPQLLVEPAEAKSSETPEPETAVPVKEPEVATKAPAKEPEATVFVDANIIPIKKVVVDETRKEKPAAKASDIAIPEEIKKPLPKMSGAGLVQEPEEDFREVAQAEPKPSALSSLAAKLFVDRSQSGVAAPAKAKITPLKEKFVTLPPKVAAKAEAPLETAAVLPKAVLSPVSQDSSVTEKMTSFREEMKKRDAEDKLPVTELNAPEVTQGLSQLLSEWKLFKSSGFLGTGPSGLEHPLYQKLKVMPMASVIAGRFEGASPEIKQSITDYMNGWRYEQGLIHEMGETFEHYLRRVILHILERQTEAPKA